MGLTDRGKKLVLVVFAVGLFSLVFRDFVLLISACGLGLVLFFDFFRARRVGEDLSEFVELEPRKIEGELTAGEDYSQELVCRNGSGLELELDCFFEDGGIAHLGSIGEEGRFDFFFEPDLAGEYEFDSVRGSVVGRFDLWREEGEVPLEQSFRVLPRVMAAAMAAARYLEAAGESGFGEQPTMLKGAGLEYAGTREYHPGDDLRHLDWKATARLREPVVKEFYLESGLGVHLAYEAEAPDPVSLDKLSASFLNTALSLAKRSISAGLTVFAEGEVRMHVDRVRPDLALALAMREALRAARVEVREFYSVLEPRTSRRTREILQGLESSPVKTLLKENLGDGKDSENPYQVLRRVVRDSEGRLNIIFNSSLSGDIKPILELDDFASREGCRLQILQPATPWKYGNNLEENYRIHEKYSRIYSILKNRNIPISGSVEGLVKELSSNQPIARKTSR